MKSRWEDRWSHAYERAKKRVTRRVLRVLALIDADPVRPLSLWVGDEELRRADVLLGEAAKFKSRVHGLLLKPRQ